MAENTKKGANTLLRSLGIGTLLAVAVSNIAPTASVFMVYGSVLQTVGTGMALAFLVGGLVAILNSFIFAELGTAFPLSGGSYAILLRVFGKPVGLVASLLQILLGIGVVPALALAGAGYLNTMFPKISSTEFVVVIIIISMLVAMLRIHSASWITAVMVILEFAIIIGVIILSLFHAIHPISFAWTCHAVTNKGVGSPLGMAVIFAALPVTLFSFSGYEVLQNFSEEAVNVRRDLGKAIIISAIIGVLIQTFGVMSLTMATKDFGAAMSSADPGFTIVQQVLGNTGANVLMAGVIIATIDLTIAAFLVYVRVFYNSARDGVFTPRVSHWLAEVSPKTKVPVRIALVWGIMSIIVAVSGTLNSALAFTGVVLILMYAFVAIAALIARGKFPERIAYKMPFWPILPIVVLGMIIYVLTQQDLKFIEITIGAIIVFALYYALVMKNIWKKQEFWEPGEDNPAGSDETA